VSSVTLARDIEIAVEIRVLHEQFFEEVGEITSNSVLIMGNVLTQLRGIAEPSAYRLGARME
jgi:hypothetical protein